MPNKRGISENLLQLHLEEFIYPTRISEMRKLDLFVHYLKDATNKFPIKW